MEGGGLFDGLDEFRDELDDDLLAIANDNLADADICELAGVERIEDVRSLALVVKTTDGNSVLGDLGTRVTQLSSLKLSGSHIASIRDLGTNWSNLEVLWLARCGLNDVDGLHGLNGLRELYLAFNDIVDLSGFVALEQLSVLDLEANKVADLGQIEFLVQCTELTDLTLQHNPAAQSPGYRQVVCSRLSQLCTLDERPITAEDRTAPGASSGAGPAQAPGAKGGPGGMGAGLGGGDEAMQEAATEDADPLAEVRRELQLVMDGVKYAQVEGLTAGIGAAGSPMRRPATALSSRPTTAAGSWRGRPLSGGSLGSALSRPRTSWRAPGLNALEGGGSAPLRANDLVSVGSPVNSLRAQRHSSPAAAAEVVTAGRPALARPSTASRAPPASARPGSALTRPASAGRVGPGRKPPVPNGRPLVHSTSSEDNSSALTIGTQSVFCGTGIRALRAHKLRPDEAEAEAEQQAAEQLTARSEPLPAGRSRLSSCGSTVDDARPSMGGHALPEISSETVVRQQWSKEYAEMLQQLKAVKLEEAWEGHDAFAAMEMGIDTLHADDADAEPTHVAEHVAASLPLRRRPGRATASRADSPSRRKRAGTLSSSGGAEILTLDVDGARPFDEPGPDQWHSRTNAALEISS